MAEIIKKQEDLTNDINSEKSITEMPVEELAEGSTENTESKNRSIYELIEADIIIDRSDRNDVWFI